MEPSREFRTGRLQLKTDGACGRRKQQHSAVVHSPWGYMSWQLIDSPPVHGYGPCVRVDLCIGARHVVVRIAKCCPLLRPRHSPQCSSGNRSASNGSNQQGYGQGGGDAAKQQWNNSSVHQLTACYRLNCISAQMLEGESIHVSRGLLGRSRWRRTYARKPMSRRIRRDVLPWESRVLITRSPWTVKLYAFDTPGDQTLVRAQAACQETRFLSNGLSKAMLDRYVNVQEHPPTIVLWVWAFVDDPLATRIADWMVTINGGTWDGFHACAFVFNLPLVRLGQQHDRKKILKKIWGSFSYCSHTLWTCTNTAWIGLNLSLGFMQGNGAAVCARLAVIERNIFPLSKSALTRFLTDPKWKRVNVIAAVMYSFSPLNPSSNSLEMKCCTCMKWSDRGSLPRWDDCKEMLYRPILASEVSFLRNCQHRL